MQQLASANDELPTVVHLQHLHTEANGGHANLQSLVSLVASGAVTDMEGALYDFKLYRKRPDKMRIQLELLNGSIITFSDGERVFQKITRRGSLPVVSEIFGKEYERIKADGPIDGQFYQLRAHPEWLEVVGEVDIEGEPAYEIRIDEHADTSYRTIWLNKEHFQEVKLRRFVALEDGEGILEDIYFSDFEQFRGIWMARRIRYVRDEELMQTVELERIKINVGLFDSFFEKPRSE